MCGVIIKQKPAGATTLHTRDDTSITGAWAPKSVTVLYKMTIKDTWSLFNITIVGCVALSRDKNIPGHKTSQRAIWWCPDIFFASLSLLWYGYQTWP